MSVFEIILLVCGIVIVGAIAAALVLILVARDVLTRAVVADAVFYGMVGAFLLWTFSNQSSIDYEIVFLAAIVGGVLPTLSMSRMISRGRR